MWVPETCTLPTVEQPLRVAEFDEFFTSDARAVRRVSATRLDFVIAAVAEQTGRDLAARESGCCSFFTFEFMSTEDSVVMSVQVPASQVPVLDALQSRALAVTPTAGESL